jgi:ubiquitin-activating enzyme E1
VDVHDPGMTVEKLVQFMRREYGVDVNMLSHGVSIVYSMFMNPKKMKERKHLTLSQVVELVTRRPILSEQKYLIFEMIVNDIETEKEVDIPYLRFKLH